jgi:hypothetical protein
VRTFHLKPANLNNVRDALLANVDTASELHTDEAPLYEQHLQRYLNEFQFRHNHRVGLGFSDGERTAKALRSIEGRRLTYRPTNGAQN